MFANVADKQAVAQILFYPFIIPLLQSQGTNHFFPHFLPSQIKLSPRPHGKPGTCRHILYL